jgi:hypothetical protein
VRLIAPTAVDTSSSLDFLAGQGLTKGGVMVLPLGTGFTLEPLGNTAQMHPVTLPSDKPQRPRRRAPRMEGPWAGCRTLGSLGPGPGL